MENTNPPMSPPPTGNTNPYQQAPGGYQQAPGGYQQPFQGMQADLPGAGGTLTLGILAIPFAIGLLGPIFGIIALTKASKAINEYNLYPGRYTPSSLSKVKAGKTCGIIGLSLFGLGLLIAIAVNA
jgi:hypothetical protein